MLVGGFRDRSINNLTQASPCTAWPRFHDESKGLIPHGSCGLAAREALTSLKSVTYSTRTILVGGRCSSFQRRSFCAQRSSHYSGLRPPSLGDCPLCGPEGI